MKFWHLTVVAAHSPLYVCFQIPSYYSLKIGVYTHYSKFAQHLDNQDITRILAEREGFEPPEV